MLDGIDTLSIEVMRQVGLESLFYYGWGLFKGLESLLLFVLFIDGIMHTEEDIHSPTTLKWWQILLGFYKEPKLHRRLISDLIQDKNIKFCQRHYFKVIVTLNVILFIIDPVLPGLIMGIVNLHAFYSTGIIINWLNHLGGKPNNNIFYFLCFKRLFMSWSQ